MVDILTNEILAPVVVAAIIGAGGLWYRCNAKRTAEKRHMERRLRDVFEMVDEDTIVQQREKLEELERCVEKMKQSSALRRDENTLIIKSLYALTSGLKQLGCNGEVEDAHKELQEFVLEERS